MKDSPINSTINSTTVVELADANSLNQLFDSVIINNTYLGLSSINLPFVYSCVLFFQQNCDKSFLRTLNFNVFWLVVSWHFLAHFGGL